MHERIKYDPTGAPGTWRELYLEDPLKSRVIEVNCPNGHAAHIHIQNRSDTSKNWQIDVEGEVTPSILCLTPHPQGQREQLCNWHVMAQLEQWRPEWNE